LTIRKRKKGPDVWQFRWTENWKPKSVLIGTLEKLPTLADAERASEHLRIKINAQNPQQRFHALTVGALIDRFMAEYAPKRCRKLTQKVYRSIFENHIRPKWGGEFVQDVRTMALENWLESYLHSRQVKSHVRNLMHTMY
jgi:integrase